jgi:hypothetical protein
MSFFQDILRRLTGWPIIKVPYRAHWRVAADAHPLVIKLFEDSPDGETCRMALSEWYHSERPVIDYFRGISSAFRIEGPWHEAGNTLFPMGALIRSPGVVLRLGPIETVELDERIRSAIEHEILRRIDAHDGHARGADSIRINRRKEDPKAVAEVAKWLAEPRTEIPLEEGASHD